jgi:hypothetical protein
MHKILKKAKLNSHDFKIRKHSFLLLILLVGHSLLISAQISFAALEVPYGQSFDGLGSHATTNSWTSNVTLPGWYAVNTDLNGFVTNYRGDNNTNGSLYSYGNSSDRALGSLASGGSGDIIFGAHFENNTGSTVNSIVLSFRVEHWRRSLTSLNGHQRTKVSYAIDDNMNVTPAFLFDDNNFMEVPEAYLISIDTIPTELSLNGNASFVELFVRIPVFIPNGSELFLRFDDDNLPQTDVGLAVDDLQLRFSSTIEPRISVMSGYTVFSYLDMGIVEDIPTATGNYIDPLANHITDWQQILEAFYDDDNLNDVDPSLYGYEVTEFHTLTGNYQVLRKHNHSAFFWGTYVKLIMPEIESLLIQAPHAVDDNETGTQASAVFYLTRASGLMLSGITRCASILFSDCDGMTTSCSVNDMNEKFRKSDVSHEPNTIFHLATTVLANLKPSLVFVQLHGFSQDDNDPHFIISCGTENAELKSVPDYPVILRENLLNIYPLFEIQITHVDQYGERGAKTNVQGRYLNLYPPDICENAADPTTVTNRFLHIEQYPRFREVPIRYVQMAIALSQTINDDYYERAILLQDEFSFHQEDFNNLYAANKIEHTWGNNLHIPGWYAAGTENDLFSIYHLAYGQLNDGGIYSFGEDDSGDRALGSIATSSSSSAGDIAYGALFRNTSGFVFNSMELSYDSEQWRTSNQASVQTVELSYRIDDEIDLRPVALLDNTAYMRVPNGDLLSSNSAVVMGSVNLDGNMNANQITVLVPIQLQVGEEIFIRFFDANNPSEDKAMAIDNFTATFSTEIPMPVDWTYFNVSKKNGRPLLQWGADKEDECKNYEVLRSDDGKTFEPIQTVPCQGKPLQNRYEVIDYSPLWNRIVYYKIAQYDFNGEVTFSPVKAFSQSEITKPEVYFKDGKILIQTGKDANLKSVAAYDFMGREFCKGFPVTENTSTYSLDCPYASNQLVIVQLIFESGNYIAHLRTGN